MTDHKEEAERLHSLAGIDPKELAGIGALTQAVLYLAEQQRIANLLALFHLDGPDQSDFATRGVIWPQVAQEITEGLGLK